MTSKPLLEIHPRPTWMLVKPLSLPFNPNSRQSILTLFKSAKNSFNSHLTISLKVSQYQSFVPSLISSSPKSNSFNKNPPPTRLISPPANKSVNSSAANSTSLKTNFCAAPRTPRLSKNNKYKLQILVQVV